MLDSLRRVLEWVDSRGVGFEVRYGFVLFYDVPIFPFIDIRTWIARRGPDGKFYPKEVDRG